MRLVVDTNILFCAFWKDSYTRKMIFSGHELYSPQYALEELNNHSSEIMKKAGISKERFNSVMHELAMAIIFVPLKEYSSHLVDSDDADFLALASKLSVPLWSNDAALKKEKVVVVNTLELNNFIKP